MDNGRSRCAEKAEIDKLVMSFSPVFMSVPLRPQVELSVRGAHLLSVSQSEGEGVGLGSCIIMEKSVGETWEEETMRRGPCTA